MKKNLKHMVEYTDASKKVNPLDLSSDQDLTIALMNLVAIEEIAPNGQIGQIIGEMREHLMGRMTQDTEIMVRGRDLLAQAVRAMEDAARAQQDGNNVTAYKLYDASYEAYVLYLASVYGISA
ncbi:MAG: hypothetical protein IJW84_02165 [Alphaproteobacteria bacterium]|nr:hypothetical protein [Alphaproteobacteria bacterium]MBQ7289677.1 hypothetical protein [Alphaproteobacteria bacterium]